MAFELPAQVLLGDRIGDADDAVELVLGPNVIAIYEGYDVRMSVLQQPAAFTLRLGWSKTAAELLDAARPGIDFELRIHGVVVQSGKVDGRRLKSSDGGTFVEVKGRDWMAAVYDSFVEEERSFADKTFFDLTRTILDLVGLQDRGLVVYAGPESAAFKKAITGKQIVRVINEEVVRQIETGAKPEGTAAYVSKAINKTLKAKLGERWYDWLQRQYKLKGLFLWCTGEGNFVLGQPDWEQEPAFTILRARGLDREFATVLDVDWRDDTTGRHSEIVVHGRAGGGAQGRRKVTGRYVDQEITSRGITKRLVVHDEDCKTAEECEFVARRTAAEERRSGWSLEYTVSGHTMPGITGGSGNSIWCPDMMCRVSDDEIPLDGLFYVESVQYSRNPATTTTITLMRPEDLVFAKPEQTNRKAPKLKRAPKG